MKTYTEIVVRNYHIDHFGHVNHARFVEMLEEARWQYLEDNNLLDAIHRTGAFHVVAEIHIHYCRPVVIGDTLCFETHVEGRSHHRFAVEQHAHLKTSGKIALKAVVTNVFIDGRSRPRKIDSAILEIWPDLAHAELLKSFSLSPNIS